MISGVASYALVDLVSQYIGTRIERTPPCLSFQLTLSLIRAINGQERGCRGHDCEIQPQIQLDTRLIEHLKPNNHDSFSINYSMSGCRSPT